MQRPDIRFRVRHLMIGVAVAAVGLFLLRSTWDKADEVIVRQYPEDWRPWSRGDAVRVRLDLDRLRAYDLSKEDVMEALRPSGMVDAKKPPPRLGVVFVTRSYRPVRYENIILKASPKGEIVRLNDVAKVEVGW